MSVCCGASGICSILQEIGRRKNEDNLVSTAKTNLKELLRTIHEKNMGIVEFDFGMFTGFTGTAYTCLNVYNHGKLPNLMMMY